MTIARKTRGIIRRGTRANQPAATDVLEGTLYFVTDEIKVERSNGATWDAAIALGEKVDVAFDADLFTGNSGVGDWTVALGDVETLSYTLLGDTAIVVFAINTTTVASSPSALRIELPFTAAVTSQALGRQFNSTSAAGSVILVSMVAASNLLQLRLLDGTAWPNGTNDTYVFGTAVIFL